MSIVIGLPPVQATAPRRGLFPPRIQSCISRDGGAIRKTAVDQLIDCSHSERR
jgi:hypothetical protein